MASSRCGRWRSPANNASLTGPRACGSALMPPDLPNSGPRHHGVTGSGSGACAPGSRIFVSATSNHDVIQRLGLTEHQLDRVKVLEVSGELDLWTAPTLCERIEQCHEEPLL